MFADWDVVLGGLPKDGSGRWRVPNMIMESRPLALNILVFQAIGNFGSRNLSQFQPSPCLG